MAALRPVVLVFQEFAEVSVAAAQPDLNTLIAGPAYHIRDFPADQADIGIGDYASETAACDATGDPAGLPVTGVDVIVVADPPDNEVGALLEEETVEVWMDEALVQVVQGIDGVVSTTSPDENEFTSAGATFETDGVAIGDRLVFTSDVDTFARIVQSVESETVLRFTQNWIPTGAVGVRSTNILGNDPGGDSTPSSLDYRVERRLAAPVLLDSAFVDISGNSITVTGGVTTLVDLNGDGADQIAQVNFFEAYVGYLSLRQDLAVVGEIEGTTAIEGAAGRIDERNPLAVGLFLALQNTTTPIKYYGVSDPDLSGYTDMLALIEPRTDIYAIVPMSSDLAVIAAIKTHVAGLADPEISNFRIGIGSSEGLPLAKTIGSPSIVGASEQVSTDNFDVVALDGATFSADGVQAGDTLAIVENAGTVTLAELTVAQVYDDERLQMDATIAPLAADEVGSATHFYVYRGAGPVDRVIAATGGVSVSGADTVDVGAGNGLAADVGKVIRLTGAVTNATNSPLTNNDFLIESVAGDVYTVTGPGLVAEVGPFAASIIETLSASTSPGDATTKAVTFRQPFRRLLDATATFATNGVIPTDFLEVPIPAVPAGTTFTTVEQLVINAVDSENRVTLVAGSDIPTVDIDTGDTDIGYRVRRTLAKSDQVDELNAVVASIAEKRITMVWPDEVLVSGVLNEKTGIQSHQPGYYLAAVVGGLSAGLPAHQGFTNLGIAGIDEIFNSTRYFSQTQLTDLSNAGWFVFEQETENSLPYVVHQLTTDVSTTENGELSIVRDFDFVALFYKAILEPFIGRYNVIPSTLDLIREALNNGTLQLRGQVLPRIGAPIVDAEITSIAVLPGSGDRVEVFMDVVLPFPLNRIGLHLVA
jgi:hypothetical protein